MQGGQADEAAQKPKAPQGRNVTGQQGGAGEEDGCVCFAISVAFLAASVLQTTVSDSS